MTIERSHAQSGCKAVSGNLICHLHPHAADLTSSHWDADAGTWWQTEAEHVDMAAHLRQALDVDDDLADRITELGQLAADMLASFTKSLDGYRARAGQVQIGKWSATLRGDQ